MATKESALLFSARGRDPSISGDGINFSFDILTSESHSWSVKVSSHPVQKGSPFTDHIAQQLRKGGIVGLISNFGLKRGELTDNFAQDTFDLLENYKENIVPVTIVTTLKVYENYIISDVKESRTGEMGEAQSFSISFQEFRTVKLKSTGGIGEINIPSSDLEGEGTDVDDSRQASTNSDVGEQNAEDPTGRGKLERFVNFTDFASGVYK